MKKNLKLRAYVSPTPAIIAAAYGESGRADACTLAFYTPSSHVPPCVTIAINATAKRKTLKSIVSSGAFTIGYPSVEQAKEADYIGIDSSYDRDKISAVGWTISKATSVNAPVINEIALTLECKVVNTVTVGSHTQITGQVMNILADDSILDDKGKVDIGKLNPLIYDEEHFGYHKVGTRIANAFKDGISFRASKN